jgi:hypothetical protein
VLGDGPVPAEGTSNPADALADILTAYGAARLPPRRARSICRDAHHTARSVDGYNGFNGAFAQRSTVYEALTTALGGVVPQDRCRSAG